MKKRIATLLTIAGITLVGYTGAVYSVLSHGAPDSAPEPVYNAVEVVEESHKTELEEKQHISQEEAKPMKEKDAEIIPETEPITTPYEATLHILKDRGIDGEQLECFKDYMEKKHLRRFEQLVSSLTIPRVLGEAEKFTSTDVCAYNAE